MLTVSFPAQAFGTNCYVLADAPGEECVIVDPGIGIEETLREVLTTHRLKPAAVLLTHGHVDHVFSVTPVCGGELAAYIHTDDRYRLADPLSSSSLGPALSGMLEQQFGKQVTWREPETVVEITDSERLTVAGLELEVAVEQVDGDEHGLRWRTRRPCLRTAAAAACSRACRSKARR